MTDTLTFVYTGTNPVPFQREQERDAAREAAAALAREVVRLNCMIREALGICAEYVHLSSSPITRIQRALTEEPPRDDQPPRRFPVGSPEPGDVWGVRSEQNGVVFQRRGQQRPFWWVAKRDSGGDSGYYSWRDLNAENATEGGMPLVEVPAPQGGARP